MVSILACFCTVAWHQGIVSGYFSFAHVRWLDPYSTVMRVVAFAILVVMWQVSFGLCLENKAHCFTISQLSCCRFLLKVLVWSLFMWYVCGIQTIPLDICQMPSMHCLLHVV